jgi:hypothetical protein
MDAVDVVPGPLAPPGDQLRKPDRDPPPRRALLQVVVVLIHVLEVDFVAFGVVECSTCVC